MTLAGPKSSAVVLYSLAAVGVMSIVKQLYRSASSAAMPKKIALVVAGSGVYDGSEITEVVSTLIHLSRSGADVTSYAPDKDQMHVINHTTGEEMDEKRNVLVESARICRGAVKPLSDLNTGDYDALVIPGGFGAAKNLSDFAVKGGDMTVDPDLEKIMTDFNSAGKPIGLCCIAPTLAAKVFGSKVKVTVGKEEESEAYPHAGAAGAVKAMGAEHVETEPGVACIDGESKIVTSTAYMYSGRPDEIDDSVKAMVDGVLSLM